MRSRTLRTVLHGLAAGLVLSLLGATAPAIAAPPPPCCVATDDITPHTVDVYWGASPGAVKYHLFVNGVRWTQLDPAYSSAMTLATLRHLPFNTAITIGVRAVDAAGRESAAATVQTGTAYYMDTIAPAPPTNLHVSASPFGPPVSGCPRYLRWTAGVDNYNDTYGESEVYRDGLLVGVVRRGGQDQGGLYHYIGHDGPGSRVYTVKTLDQGGNTSAASVPLTVSSAAC